MFKKNHAFYLIIFICFAQHCQAGMVLSQTDQLVHNFFLQLSTMISGSLGRVIVAAMLIIGIFIGVLKQSLMTFIVSTGLAFLLSITPNIINKVMLSVLIDKQHSVLLIDNNLNQH